MSWLVKFKIRLRILGIKIHLAVMRAVLSSVEKDLQTAPDKSHPAHIKRARSRAILQEQKQGLELMLVKFTELLEYPQNN